jgi:hypothetical protein
MERYSDSVPADSLAMCHQMILFCRYYSLEFHMGYLSDEPLLRRLAAAHARKRTFNAGNGPGYIFA